MMFSSKKLRGSGSCAPRAGVGGSPRAQRLITALAILTLGTASAFAQARSIVVASTTSTQDSGLFSHILPLFKAKTGIDVKVIAQGTGQALDTGRRGDADVIFVHAKAQEEKFVADGFGVARFDVMYNDFVLIGPTADPAKIKGSTDIIASLRAIDAGKATFVSRGDKSGTHAAELALWKQTSLGPACPGAPLVAQSQPACAKPSWYREIGQGMGAALNTAGAMGAYVLADRGTWISFKNKGDLQIAIEGDARLFNPYGIILVNPAKHPTVKRDLGQAFIDWILSPEGQNAIRSYTIDGQQLFFPSFDVNQSSKKAG